MEVIVLEELTLATWPLAVIDIDLQFLKIIFLRPMFKIIIKQFDRGLKIRMKVKSPAHKYIVIISSVDQ